MSFWGVVQTETLREHTAQRWLDSDFETYLPVIKIPNGRTVPIFPSYLFVLIELYGWGRIDNSIGVIQLLRSGDQPARLPDDVIPKLKSQERGGIVRLPRPRGILVGDKVQILKGSFADCIGLYDGQPSKDRVAVLLDLFNRKTRVEFDKADIRPITGN